MSRALHDLDILYSSAKEADLRRRIAAVRAEIANLEEAAVPILAALRFYDDEHARQALRKLAEIKERAR